MPKKSAILNNVTEYSPEDLASYIQQGFVTLDELVNNTDGEFTAKMQLGVEKLLAGSEDEDFKKVMESASIADFQDFLNKYPMGTVAHLDAVRERKHVLERFLLLSRLWKNRMVRRKNGLALRTLVTLSFWRPLKKNIQILLTSLNSINSLRQRKIRNIVAKNRQLS